MSRLPFEYAVVRAVPRVDRGEFVNVGVLVYCDAADYLGAAVHVDRSRLGALDPTVDLDAVESALASVVAAADGSGLPGAATEDIGRRFRWLTAPRSTVVQPGPVHTGLTADPTAETDRLLAVLVLPPRPAPGPNARGVVGPLS